MLASLVWGLLEHKQQNRVEEARIFREGRVVAGGEGGLYGLLRGGSNEFETANENAGGGCGRGLDVQGKNGIDEISGNDVNKASAFFEPGSFPGFEHGVSFVWKKALGDEHTFKVAGERIQGTTESGHGERGFAGEGAKDAITQFCPATLKEDYVGNGLSGFILKAHGIV